MLKSFDFSFSNEYQHLHLEVKVSEPDLIFKVHEAVGVTGVVASNEWKIYSGEAIMWLKSFIELRTFEWASSYSNASIYEDAGAKLPQWSLYIEEDEESELEPQKIVGLNSYPDNFPDFLELLRKLLGLSYLILEV